MGNFLKLLPLILQMKDVTNFLTEKQQSPDGKPFYYTQRFWGTVSVLAFGILGYFTIDTKLIGMTPEQLSINLTNLATNVGVAAGSIYGLVMVVKGVIDAQKRKTDASSTPIAGK